MRYTPGPAPFAILCMAVISGILLLIFPAPKTEAEKNAEAWHQATGKTGETLQFWTFAKTHFDAYKQLIPLFEKENPGFFVEPQYVHLRAVTSRLRSAFASDLPQPDLLETEISTAGTFFLGPMTDIGFVDLTDELNKPRPDGPPLIDRVVRSRFAPYTTRGRIFGLPHDVHPVLLGYRKDIFDRYGVDAEKLTTWDEFIRVGREIMQKMNSGPTKDHYLLDISDVLSDHIEMLLFQRDGGYFSPDGSIRFDDEIAVQTMLWFVPLVAKTAPDDSGKIVPNPERVGNTFSGKWEAISKSIDDDAILAFFAPDWLTMYYERNAVNGSGKYALMPLPAFTPGGRRTSTRGGTMIGFTKKSQHFDKAFELALLWYYDVGSRIAQFKETNILPPVKEAWKHPALDEPRPYWSNKPLGRLYADQADQTPPQYSSPYIQLAKSKLAEALSECVGYFNKNGHKDLENYVRKRLKQSADEVRMQMELNPYK